MPTLAAALGVSAFVTKAAVRRLALEGVLEARPSRDTIYLFSDDHLARGAFLAIAEAGLTIPRDIRIATWANAGIGPFHPRELSRMEIDPVAAGETLARAALEFLRTGAYPAGTSIGPVWHDGETMGIPTTSDA